MKFVARTLVLLVPLVVSSVLAPRAAYADSGSLDVHWLEGAEDCDSAKQPPLQVHRYDPQTYILRQSPCADFEAPFMYLLIGSRKALLIDTGAVQDAERMPLARTVMDLLPSVGDAKLPLLVVHSHSHSDHLAGDAQFAGLPAVEVAPTQLDAMQEFMGFKLAARPWPDGIVHIDLGNRTVDVVGVPGHEPAHLLFYDSRTEVLFSGDFLLPGRLMINDLDAYRSSAARAVEFVQSRPVSHIFGAHIELDKKGELYVSGTQHHPAERALPLEKADLLALPAAMQDFNGFYARYPNYVLTHPMHNLIAFGLASLLVIAFVVWGLRRWFRSRRTAA